MGVALVRAQVLVRGDVSCMRTLTRWAERAGQSEVALKAVSDFLEESERELFATQGASGGEPWQPLAEATLDSPDRRGGSGDILRVTDALYDSLTESSDPNAIREIGPGFLRFGTRLAYAEALRRGDDKMPARNPMVITRKMRYTIVKLLQGWITGSVSRGLKPSIRTMRGPWL